MRTKTAFLLTVLCMFILLAPLAAVTSNQNLDWGVEIGDRFNFYFRYEDYYEPIYSKEYDCYIVVESLPIIPDDINEVFSLQYFNESADLGVFLANGTDMGPWSAHLPQMILPVGNWILWSNLLEDYEASSTYHSESVNITETFSTWTWTHSSQYYSDELTGEDGTATFRKTDGVLSYFRYAGLNNMGNKYFEYEITEVGIIPQMGVYLALAGVIVGIIAVAVLYKKR